MTALPETSFVEIKTPEKRYEAIMIDIEAMGLGPNAAIIQIGAIIFREDDGKIKDRFDISVDLMSSLNNGGEVDQETVDWWKSQGGPK